MRKNNIEAKEQEIEITPGPWEIGKVYTTCQDLYVWNEAGEEKAAYDNLPEEVKEFAFEDDFGQAILNTGARVAVEEVKEIRGALWIKAPFGWICGKNPKITYVS